MRIVTIAGRCTTAALLCLLLAPNAATADDLYEYDAAGRLTKVTYHTGHVAQYAYDNRSNVTSVTTSTIVAVEPSPETPAFVNTLRTGQPNPARGETMLRFSLARRGTATLRVFDVSGRLVQTLTHGEYPAGEFETRLTVSKWAAGVYFYRLEAPGFTATRRLVVLK